MEDKLPEGWEWKKLGDLIELKYGKGLKKENRDTSGKFPVYGSNGIVDYHDEAIVFEPCLIVGRKGSIGAVHLSKSPCWAIDTTYYILPPKEVDLTYLFYLLPTLKLENLNKSTAIPGLNREDVYSKLVPVPPLETQQKIVSILEKAEETKNLRAQADELTQKLLRSVFLEMFGDPVKNTKNWNRKALKEFGEIITGNTPSRKKPEYYGNYIEWIKSDNINTPYTYLTKSEEMLSEKGVKVGRIAPINSVLVTCIAGSLSCIGNVAIADRDVTFNQQINAIVPNENVNALFLYHLILNTKKYIQHYSTQSMKGMISKGVFSSISFIMPQIESQVKFAEFAKKVEKMIISQNHSSIEINALFDALMQKAFTGEIIS